MSILSGLGSSGGLIAGAAAVLGVAALTTTVVLTVGEPDPSQNAQDQRDKAVVVATPPVATKPSPEAKEPVIVQDAGALAAPSEGKLDAEMVASIDPNVSATVIGDQIVATASLGEDVNPSSASIAKPKIGLADTVSPQSPSLRFDLVRVDKSGGAVVAGKAVAGAKVEILLNGEAIATIKADKKGAFVALFDMPSSSGPQVMTLTATDTIGDVHVGRDRVIVMGREVEVSTAESASDTQELTEEKAAPAIIIASEDGVKILQPAEIVQDTPQAAANVTLDLITYDESGEVVLTGRGDTTSHVRIYVDDKPVKTAAVTDEGAWQLSLPEVEAGRYTLRVDEIDIDGQVTSRLETPFQKEGSVDVKRVASVGGLSAGQSGGALPNIQKITIQPGATLWAVAEATYGQGDLYMQIFDANRDNIRDPNLIYPGQIFALPE